MPHNSLALFNALKNEVLTLAEIKALTPADCKRLSELIATKTKVFLSETTLKRVYGFAVSRYNPSLFTKNVMAQYCDCDGWDAYVQKNLADNPHTVEVQSWGNIRARADRVTMMTLQALKSRSGIPYCYTVPRDAVARHFEAFEETGQLGTVLCAPSGHGKTIALCNWLDQRTSVNDVVVLFSSTTIMSALQSEMDLNVWMRSLLGCERELNLDSLIDANTQQVGNFYLVIDGFDERGFKKDNFKILLSQLKDACAIYQKFPNVKIVLTLRPETWKNHFEKTDLESKFFTGFFAGQTRNIPLLTSGEIRMIAKKINAATEEEILSANIINLLQNPLFVQFFYKQHAADQFSFAHIDKTTAYELYADYILNKIYIGHYATEKVALMRSLVTRIDVHQAPFQMDLLPVCSMVKEYQHAFEELIANGILGTVNESNRYDFHSVIQFTSPEFLTYNLAKSALLNNKNVFDTKLIADINSKFKNSSLKLEVLKWCLVYGVKTGQHKDLECLVDADLSFNEKADFVIFIADLFKKELKGELGAFFVNHFKNQQNKKLFDYFFGLELLSPEYAQALNTLLLFNLPNTKKILVYTAQALFAAANLKLEELNYCIDKLKEIDKADHFNFATDPLLCLETIYKYLKYGEVHREGLIKLTSLCFNGPEDAQNLKKSAANDMLYILALYTMLVTGNPKKLLRMAGALNSFYKEPEAAVSETPYRFFIMAASADSYYKLGQLDKISEIYQFIDQTYKPNENAFTPYMQMLLHCIKIKVLMGTSNESNIVHEINCITSLAKEGISKLSMMYSMSIVVNQEDALQDHPAFRKQLVYDYNKLLRHTALTEIVLVA